MVKFEATAVRAADPEAVTMADPEATAGWPPITQSPVEDLVLVAALTAAATAALCLTCDMEICMSAMAA